jgi:hypothetical protein
MPVKSIQALRIEELMGRLRDTTAVIFTRWLPFPRCCLGRAASVGVVRMAAKDLDSDTERS